MALRSRINPLSRTYSDTGFGVNASNYGGRFINKDGSFNLERQGLPFWQRMSVFYNMLSMPRWKFILLVIIFYILINLFFAGIYYYLGIEHLGGVISRSGLQNFAEAFFFSAQTFTTVGYGRINPVGFWVNCVAAIESLAGLMSFAIATGLIYGRFAKPRSYLAFSDYALVAPYQGKTGLMFRLVSYKDNHHLTDAEIKVNLGLTVEENGVQVNKFYSLQLERSRIDSLSMNWTVVHPIDENSPILGFTEKDLENAQAEIYVMIRGYDDVFSNIVLQRTSYTYDEIKFGAKFVPMYHESEDGRTTILELDKLNVYEKAALPTQEFAVNNGKV